MVLGEAAFVFWVKNRDRECAELQKAEGKELHGSSTRGMSVRRATFIFRTRGVLLNTDRVHYLACTGLERLLHGACPRGVQNLPSAHGAC